MTQANETNDAVMAYHIDYDGGAYTAYCDGCLMQCEVTRTSARRALEVLLDYCTTVTGCSTATREATFVAQGRVGGRPTGGRKK